ncbi:MAG: transglutaminase-like domain-containing protein [Bacteroidetes bacterium]|nr:transglutaminase-like domain-containing protein [Bacteroidota bacterium]MBU1718026.1 transglutaminase-like domain-containing protein [Bacteroidota bacterium]
MKEAEEIKALISLLDDPDSEILSQVTEKIFSYGSTAIPYLENAWEITEDEFLQSRIIALLETIQEEDIRRELMEWASSLNLDPLVGAVILSKARYPDLAEKEVFDLVEKIRKSAWLELNNELTALEKIKVLNHVIYSIYGFHADPKTISEPENHYINTALSKKSGNPLSLGILYIHLAEKLGMAVVGVNLPEHFVLAYVNSSSEISFLDKNKVLFYINPFNQGTVFSRNEIEVYLKKMKYPHKEEYFLPCDSLTVVRLYLMHLILIFKKENKEEKLEFLKSLVPVLTKKSGESYEE